MNNWSTEDFYNDFERERMILILDMHLSHGNSGSVRFRIKR